MSFPLLCHDLFVYFPTKKDFDLKKLSSAFGSYVLCSPALTQVIAVNKSVYLCATLYVGFNYCGS